MQGKDWDGILVQKPQVIQEFSSEAERQAQRVDQEEQSARFGTNPGSNNKNLKFVVSNS